MKYLELLYALDILAKYYPRYHSSEVILLADDILRWMNNELPEDCSALVYLKSVFGSPAEAIKFVWKEIQCLSGPFSFSN